MTERGRLLLFLPSAALLLAVLLIGLGGLPGFGDYAGPYGFVLSGVAVTERHATDLVAAVNFDYRGFDTLGEEFILFAAVVGVMVILRQLRGEAESPHTERADDHRFGGASDALRGLALALIASLFALGGYIVAHGHLTPGGGFQGGVIFASGAFLVFVAGEYLALKRIAPHTLVEIGEAAGAAGYALVGLGGLIFAGSFFKNFLDLGKPGDLLSAGTIFLSSVPVAFEVAGAFLLIWSEFLDQAIAIRSRGEGE
jgi:multicomponent Na+:H+ antiporter subunit B